MVPRGRLNGFAGLPELSPIGFAGLPEVRPVGFAGLPEASPIGFAGLPEVPKEFCLKTLKASLPCTLPCVLGVRRMDKERLG